MNDFRDQFVPGRIGFFRLIPKLFFSANSPPPHSAPNVATSPFYKLPYVPFLNLTPVRLSHRGHRASLRPMHIQAPRVSSDLTQDNSSRSSALIIRVVAITSLYNYLAATMEIPPADRQTFYGSFTRDICGKYLAVFADFKYTRSFFDAALPPVAFGVDPFKGPDGFGFSPFGISVPIQNAFNPFTVADATLTYHGVPVPVTTGVAFTAINDQPQRINKTTIHDVLFDAGLRGEMGEFGDYFKSWNWELGFRYSRIDKENAFGGVPTTSALREALLDTNPATAFNPFLGFFGRNSNAAISRVYVTLLSSVQFELRLGYFTINGNLFNLPAGPVSFAVGGEHRGERGRLDPSSVQTTFDAEVGYSNIAAPHGNQDVWATYQEVRFPVTSPVWNFPGAYSLEFDIAEREEWYSTNINAILPIGRQPFVPAAHSTHDAQKPKFSVRWQPLDPKWVGALTLRGSYSEAFHLPY